MPLLKAIEWELCNKFLVLFSIVVRKKVTVNDNLSLTNYASRIQLPDCSKLASNQKNNIDVTICQHEATANFFWHHFISLVKFSYWSKFHVSIITGSGVMTIFLLEIDQKSRNTTIWVLPNIWRLGLVRDTIFGTNVSNEMLLNTAKCQGYSFYRFWVIKGKAIGGKITLHIHPD